LVFYGAFMGLSAFAFLLASLVIARDARRCGIPRPWPLLDRVRDRLGLNKRGSKRARPAIHWAEAVPLLLGMILLSAAWLKLAVHFFDARIHPQLGELIAQSKEWSEAVNLLRFLPPLLLAPLYEELIYRAYIQDRLLLFFRKKRLPRAGSQALLATAITAGVWALQHSGMIAPDWVKFIQIFIVGLFLGLARLRLGLEACVLIHALYNAAGCMYAPPELGALILP
jgi:membrane protease YdiL (CAAX protease family)